MKLRWILTRSVGVSLFGVACALVLNPIGAAGEATSVAGMIAPSAEYDGLEVGERFTDGEGGSVDILGLDYDFFFSDWAGGLVNGVTVLKTEYAGLVDVTGGGATDGAVFKTRAGECFGLKSFIIQDRDQMDGTWSVTAYKAGAVLGLPYEFTISQTGDYSGLVTLPANFLNVDEVRIGRAGGSSDGHLHGALFTSFVVEEPATPDLTAPTATIVVGDSLLLPGEVSFVTFTFSEPVVGFDNSDLMVSNGSLSSVSSDDGGKIWTATLTPSAGVSAGANSVTLDNTGVVDLSGNPGVGTTHSNNYAIAATGMYVSIVVADNRLAIGATTLVTFTFSEPATQFTNADLTVENGTLSTVSSADGGTTWTAILTPSEGVKDASNLIRLDNAGVADSAGYFSAGITDSNNYAIDTSSPSVTIEQAVTQADPTSSGPIEFKVVFNEPVTGFVTGDVSLSGTAGALNQSVTEIAPLDGTTYKVLVGGMTKSGTVGVSIGVGKAQDAAGNLSTGSTSSDATVGFSAGAPGVTIEQAAGQSDPATSGPIEFTVIFSEPVTGFETGDVTLSGTAGATTAVVSGSGTTYSVVVSGMTDDGSVIATIAGDVAAGEVGQGNAASNSVDNSVVYDVMGPETTITGQPGNPTNSTSANFSFSGNDGNGSGVDRFEYDLDGGGFSTAGNSLNFNGLSVGSHTVQIRAIDQAGHGDATPASFTWLIDQMGPTASLLVASTTLKAGDTSALNITFSEPVIDFTNSDLSIENGTLSEVWSDDGGLTWTAILTPSGGISDASNLVTLTNSGVTDLAGNPGAGFTDSNNYEIDTTRPSASIVVSDHALTFGETSLVTITFSEAVTGFDSLDLTIGNGSLSSLESLDSIVWTASLTPDDSVSNSANVISLNLSGVSNLAGNAGVGTANSNNYSVQTTVNSEPSFVIGADQVVTQDAGVKAVVGWASSISAGSPAEAGQQLNFVVSANKPAFFSVQPTISPEGTLRFTPAATASGDVVVTVRLHDDGGTDFGGVDTSDPQTFLISITTYLEESGVYNGLAQADPLATNSNANAGLIRVTVTKTGGFTGTLKLAGATFALRGNFGKDGAARFTAANLPVLPLVRVGLTPLALSLRLDVSQRTDKLTGTLTEGGNPFALIEADRALYTADARQLAPLRLVPNELLGRYSVGIKIGATALAPNAYPHGDGYGILTVSKNGTARLVGALADGTGVSYSNALSKDNRWPFYLAISSGKGSISGKVIFSDVPEISDLACANLRWFKPVVPLAKNYPGGWVGGLNASLVGCKFTIPPLTAQTSVLPGLSPISPTGNAQVVLVGGASLPTPMTKAVNVSVLNGVTVPVLDAERLVFKLKPNTGGLFQGSFIDPVSKRTVNFTGVILQKQKFGTGFFLVGGESGSVTITPNAP